MNLSNLLHRKSNSNKSPAQFTLPSPQPLSNARRSYGSPQSLTAAQRAFSPNGPANTPSPMASSSKQTPRLQSPPPDLDNIMATGEGSSSSSLTNSSKRLSNVKNVPSSFVRQSRRFSMSTFSQDEATPPGSFRTPPISTTPTFSSSLPVSPWMLQSQNVPEPLIPIVTLINAHQSRVYRTGFFYMPSIDLNNEKDWIKVEARLSGSELAIWSTEDEDEITPMYINITDSIMEFNPVSYDKTVNKYDIKLVQNTESTYFFRVETKEEFSQWVSAFKLSNFEYTSLNEAFTAVVLSVKGAKLSDIHTLLSKKSYMRSEWCNIRIPTISSKWLKVFAVITPAESKKKKGKVEMYTTEKISKKTLIAYINGIDSVFNVYPETPEAIDINSLIKITGEVFVNKNFEQAFVHAPQEKSRSSTSSSSAKGHGRSFSGSSMNSFKAHSRSASSSSLASTSNFFSNDSGSPKSTSKKNAHLANFVPCEFLYVMPVSHAAVSGIETMIRFYLPLVNAYKLYGKPGALKSDKTDKESLLFGLPSLPKVEYLATEDSNRLVKKHLTISIQENWTEDKWRDVYKDHLRQKLVNENFKGSGSLKEIYSPLQNLNIEEIYYNSSENSSTTFPRSDRLSSPFMESSLGFEGGFAQSVERHLHPILDTTPLPTPSLETPVVEGSGYFDSKAVEVGDLPYDKPSIPLNGSSSTDSSSSPVTMVGFQNQINLVDISEKTMLSKSPSPFYSADEKLVAT